MTRREWSVVLVLVSEVRRPSMLRRDPGGPLWLRDILVKEGGGRLGLGKE